MPQTTTFQGTVGFKLPPAIGNIGRAAAALFAVVASGSAMVAIFPDATLWQTAAAFLAPAALVFTVYWWIAQEL